MSEKSQQNRLMKAANLFNGGEWYEAHDVLEELWHESFGEERRTLQGLLQVAVAQLHLERGNNMGATILLGEGLGRLRTFGTPDLGFDLDSFCCSVEERLKQLQQNADPDIFALPILNARL